MSKGLRGFALHRPFPHFIGPCQLAGTIFEKVDSAALFQERLLDLRMRPARSVGQQMLDGGAALGRHHFDKSVDERRLALSFRRPRSA